jgi:hypothetical protein
MINFRLALRTLFKSPFVTIVAIVSLALGIGANAAIFSLFDQLLMRPLAVREPGELVNLQIADFKGFHMFYGEPARRKAGFILIDGIEKLHAFVRGNGWEQITDIETQPWGARSCDITTVDGSIMTFFELL